MGRVYVRCKTCWLWFNSGISLEPFDPLSDLLKANTHVCPNGHSHSYSSKDYADESAFERKVKRVAGRPMAGS